MGTNDIDSIADSSAQLALFISTASRDKEAVVFLNSVFYRAASEGVADVHIEDQEYDTQIRFRRDTNLCEEGRISHDMMQDVSSKIRMRAKLTIADVRKPVDGRFRLRYHDGISIDVRVSMVPTIYGQSIVCRILDQRNAHRRIGDIEMSPLVRQSIASIVEEPDGLFLITGPTGSGKTSTLYAILNELNEPTRKILTIEDPVEYRLPGLMQVNIEPGVTFADALRAGLRQDPDIILVGEIRDSETARIAVQAALTGHLVLSTLHTNDAASTVARLLDLGVDPFTLGSSLKAVAAQRLVQRMAPDHEWAPADEGDAEWLNMHNIGYAPETPFPVPVRTDSSSGYLGRVPVIEMLTMDAVMKKAVLRNDRRAIVQAAQRQPQFESLAQAGASLAARGFTSLAEIKRITSSVDAPSLSRRLGDRMIELGMLTAFQLETALARQQEGAQAGQHVRLGEIIVELGFADMEHIHEALNSIND